MFWETMGNFSFLIRWYLLIWCGIFAPFKLHIFRFLCVFFSFGFPFLCYMLIQLNIILIVIYFRLSKISSTRRMLASCIRTSFHCLSGKISFPKLSPNTNSASALIRTFQYHLVHHVQLHIIMNIFYRSQCLNLCFNLFLWICLNPCLNLFFKSKSTIQIQVLFLVTLSLANAMN